MTLTLLATPQEFVHWEWSQIEPYYRELERTKLTEGNVSGWLAEWSHLSELLDEAYNRLYVDTTLDTSNQATEERYFHFLDTIYPQMNSADQRLKQKLLSSGLEPDGFDIPLRNFRAEADLFRDENLPLLTREQKLATEYDRIIGNQTVEWDGEERTIAQLRPVYQELDRNRRERAWRLAAERQLADRDEINDLWVRFLEVRRQIAVNAEKPDYRAYRWQQLLRFDYRPEDCRRFHRAIEEVVVPVARKICEKRRRRLGVKTLRPWDLDVDPLGRPPLKPFTVVDELIEKSSCIFHRVDPKLGEYFDIMRQEGLLDLDNRKGKAPGAYCTAFAATRIPFIFVNAVGLHDDVQTVLHEAGHAFQTFETRDLPYFPQREPPMEFSEVASMGMELLAFPYLSADAGGFYTPEETARACIEHLESILLFWPYMAVVDAFQHWVYENPGLASDSSKCDAKWAELWDRFMVVVDWSGLEEVMMTGWQRKLHIHQYPFYYVEYGLAQLGAVQVWAYAKKDQAAAVSAYRKALSLGGTVTLPELYAAAGATFAMDANTLGEAVSLVEETIQELET
jgi:oligoendopeptidase F